MDIPDDPQRVAAPGELPGDPPLESPAAEHVLARQALAYGIPDHMIMGLERYIEHHCPAGGFLMAVLRNDLRGACEAADLENRKLLFNYCNYLYNCAPSTCWGSKEKVERWLGDREDV